MLEFMGKESGRCTRAATWRGREHSMVDAARAFALVKTWKFARQQSPYYRNILPDLTDDDIHPDRLRTLPVLTRELFVERIDELRTTRELPAYLTFSGGTSGFPKMMYGFERDVDLLHRESELDFALHRQERSEPPGLTLSGSSAVQGDVPLLSNRIGEIRLPLSSRRGFEWAWKFLTRSFDFDGFGPRIRHLFLPTPLLKKLVQFVLENGLDSGALALDSIAASGCYLSSGWRAKIEDVLGAPVTDIYGCTEVGAGRAVRRPGQAWHFFDDRVIWEVVDVETDQPIERGIGKILLTPLHPFAQSVPMFRYEVGDLVQIGPYDPARGDYGIRPVGRFLRTPWIKGCDGTLFPLLAVDVQELLDTHDLVARHEDARLGEITRPGRDGFPKWRIIEQRDATKLSLTLEVELKSSSHRCHDRWRRLRQELLRRLPAMNPDLKRALSQRVIDIEICGLPPGSLSSQDVVIC